MYLPILYTYVCKCQAILRHFYTFMYNFFNVYKVLSFCTLSHGGKLSRGSAAHLPPVGDGENEKRAELAVRVAEK